jgi:hypothetical protein
MTLCILFESLGNEAEDDNICSYYWQQRTMRSPVKLDRPIEEDYNP